MLECGNSLLVYMPGPALPGAEGAATMGTDLLQVNSLPKTAVLWRDLPTWLSLEVKCLRAL